MARPKNRAQLARERRRYPVEGRCIGPKSPAGERCGLRRLAEDLPPPAEGPFQPRPTIRVHASILAAWALVKLCASHQQFDPEDAVHVCRLEYVRSQK